VSEATKAARPYADEVRSGDASPLKIMAENLQFWHEGVAKLRETIEASANSIQDTQLRSELLALAEPLANARLVSQRCALDAVQFVQPKITEEH
jgi:hypothetical protein